MIASVVICAVLVFYALAAKSIADAEDFEVAAAGLLVVPTLLAATIARAGEHDITAEVLRLARFALAANAALPFVAAARLMTLAEHDVNREATLRATWNWLAVGSAVFVVLFAVSVIFPRPHGKSVYIVSTVDE